MFALIVHCILWLPVVIQTVVERRTLGPRHDCKFCEYDLSGLPEETVCPECGEAQGDRTIVVERTRVRIRQDRLHLLVFTLPAALVYTTCGYSIAERLAVYSYQVSGYSLAVSTMAAHYRDVREDDWGSVLLPVGPVIALSPLLALIRSRLRGTVVFFSMLAAASLVALGAWTLPYMKW